MDKGMVFNSIQDIIKYSNGAGTGVSNGAGAKVGVPAIALISEQIHDRVAEMLEILLLKMKRTELFERMDLSNQTKNRARYLDPLIELKWIGMEFPEDKTHPNQAYFTTEPGKRILAMLRAN